MVVPLSLDPGRGNPRSPFFEGCPDCGRGRSGGLCRECKEERNYVEAMKRRAEKAAKRHFEEQYDEPYMGGPEEVRRAYREYQRFRGDE